MKDKSFLLLVASVTLLALSITSCTQSSSSPTASPSNLPTGTQAQFTSTTAASHQVLTVNLTGEPDTIDPNRTSFASERTIVVQCFEGVLGFNPDLTLRADTAVEIPTVANGGISSDGLTYTFKLKPQVTWSDGQKVIAQDYEYSIKRMLSPDLASQYASFYFDIVGAKEYNAAASADAATKNHLRDSVGVAALDNSTLQIRLAQPRPTFLQIMALWPAFPVREDIIAKNGSKWTDPGTYIGNGPFVLTEWAHQDHITLQANPHYWGKKPALTQINLKMISDQNAAFGAYRNNELDIVQPPVGTEKSVAADPVLGKELIRYTDLSTYAFQFNVTRPPFDNVKLRQAFATAIDRVTFINNVRAGIGKVALSWIPPGTPGHDPNLGKEYDFNVAKAKQLLAEAGFSSVSRMPGITFTYNVSGANPTIAAFLQGQMKDNLGISINLEPMEAKAFSQYVKAGLHQWAWLGWAADYPDPDNWLPELFGTGAGNNRTFYSNPDFDALAQKAEHELDNAKRLQLWADAQAIVIKDAPIATMFHGERFMLVKPYVKNLTTTAMDGRIPGEMFFGDVSVSK